MVAATLKHLEIHLRVRLVEAHNLLRQQAVAHGYNCSDVDRTLGFRAHVLQVADRFVHQADDLAGALLENQSLMRDREIPLVALEELYAEFILQGLQLKTQRRLRNVQVLGCGGDVTGFRNGQKVL